MNNTNKLHRDGGTGASSCGGGGGSGRGERSFSGCHHYHFHHRERTTCGRRRRRRRRHRRHNHRHNQNSILLLLLRSTTIRSIFFCRFVLLLLYCCNCRSSFCVGFVGVRQDCDHIRIIGGSITLKASSSTTASTLAAADIDGAAVMATDQSASTSTPSGTLLSIPLSSTQSATTNAKVILPGRPFRGTTTIVKDGHEDWTLYMPDMSEVSITSMNILAPYYNVLSQKFYPVNSTSSNSTTAGIVGHKIDAYDDENEEEEGPGSSNSSSSTTNNELEQLFHRESFLQTDRSQRIPLSIEMAQRTNADILCLQEVEGGSEQQLTQLKQLLRRNVTVTIVKERGGEDDDDEIVEVVQEYDSFVWTPLNPKNKYGDIVGLCVAWRSQKHTLVNWEGFRRGMVCQFTATGTATTPTATATTTTESQSATVVGGDTSATSESDDTATASSSTSSIMSSPTCTAVTAGAAAGTGSFCVANLHLPARPSNILGRLKTMARTVRKLQELRSSSKMVGAAAVSVTPPKTNSNNNEGSTNPPTLDGLMVIAGDWNCDQYSVSAQLLKRGVSHYGNIRDRNYKSKLTKASALDLRHPFRFRDVYDAVEDYDDDDDDDACL
mmetsp:Transcript_25511/g.60354  ORF Transcript_25511/g.60354 Transcript_25511/m.60354 type:complete len:609 (+) Transcript_25511:65-1891(+)